MTALQETWYVLIVVLATGYAILDGFDLGVGVWTLFAGGDLRRRALIQAISPFWDGNEVWLLAAAGASFAAFPPVYAAVFSGFYPGMMLLLFALIFRAVCIEFSSHEPVGFLRWFWHVVLGLSSLVALLCLGLVSGSLLNGLPLDAQGNMTGGIGALFSPLALALGGLAIAVMMMHGALYLGLRLTADMVAWSQRRASTAWGASIGLTALAAVVAAASPTRPLASFHQSPALWAVPLLALLLFTGIANLYGQRRLAFGASVASILALLLTGVAATFPALVRAIDPSHSLTVGNASSSEIALHAMLIVALVGMPIVLAYTFWLYRTFRGPVSHHPEARHQLSAKGQASRTGAGRSSSA